MPTQTKNGQQIAAADPTAAPIRAATNRSSQPLDLMIQLARQGLDVSLRSVQEWGDLARQLGPAARNSPANPAMISLAYDLFEKLLAAQRQVVDALVATQRQLAHQLLEATATVDDGLDLPYHDRRGYLTKRPGRYPPTPTWDHNGDGGFARGD